MTRFRRFSILTLTLLISALVFPGSGLVLAAPRSADAPQTLQRFVVFESFLLST